MRRWRSGKKLLRENGMSERKDLRELLLERSVKRGEFVLASGALSNYYIDARLTTMSGHGQRLIGRIGLHALDEGGLEPDVVGGLTLGADPVAFAIAHAATLAGRSLDAFTVRKQAKEHGTTQLIEGPFKEGMSVVIVEDVVTSGESALRAAAAVIAAGGRVLAVLSVVDRQEGGRGRIEAAGYRHISLFTASELL
jgi:orotate phosphoribosyltransferase